MNPLDQFVRKQAPATNPLDVFVSGPSGTSTLEADTPGQFDMTTAAGRRDADYQNSQDNISKLQAILDHDPATPNAAHIKEMIAGLQASLPRTTAAGFIPVRGQSTDALPDFISGLTTGVAKGIFVAPTQIASQVAHIASHVPIVGDAIGKGASWLDKKADENAATFDEMGNPTGGGGAGAAGDFAGNLVGGLPLYGAAAEKTGAAIIERAPNTAIGKALIKAARPGASYVTRAIANIATGLGINTLAAAGAPEMSTDNARTPEEKTQIDNANLASKLKTFAVGIAADALFAAIPHGKGDTGGKEVPIVSDLATKPVVPDNGNQLPPERIAQMEAVKAKAAERAKAAQQKKLTAQAAQVEWVKQNPDKLWSDLTKDERKQVVTDHVASDPTLDTSAPVDQVAALQSQIAALNEKLSATEVDSRSAQRLSETDDLLGIGNKRALAKAAPSIDADPNMVWISADANGMKDINDNLGHDMGDQFLAHNRDVAVQAAKDAGIDYHLFRPGGDELLMAVPKDKAQGIVDAIENNSVKDWTSPDGTITKRGTLSATIHNTLADVSSGDGAAQLAARKIVAKAVHDIAGRTPEEQTLIDAMKATLKGDTGGVPVAESGAGAPAPLAGVSGVEPSAQPEFDLPPEVESMVTRIHQAGGLQRPEEMDALIHEVTTLRQKNLPAEQYNKELSDLEEDFTPYQPPTAVRAELDRVEARQYPDVRNALPTPGDSRPRQIHYDDVIGMSAKDLADAAKTQRAYEDGGEEAIFGKEGAKEYARLQKKANSTVDLEGADKASKRIEEMESGLTQAQQNRLYGIGETGLNADELKEISNHAGDYSGERVKGLTQDELLNTVGRELTVGNPDKDPVSAVRLRGAMEELRRQGISTEKAIHAGLKYRVKNRLIASSDQAMELATSRWARLSEKFTDARNVLPASGDATSQTSAPNSTTSSQATSLTSGASGASDHRPPVSSLTEWPGEKNYESKAGGLSINDKKIAEEGAPRITSFVNPKARGKGEGQKLYLRALSDGPIMHDGKEVSTEATQTRDALVRKGLAEVVKNDKGGTVLQITDAGRNVALEAGKRTTLETLKGKALEDLTEKQLTKVEDHILAQLGKVQEGSVKYEQLQADLIKIMDFERGNTGAGSAGEAVSPIDPNLQRATQAPSDFQGQGPVNERAVEAAIEAVKPPGPSIMAEPLKSMSGENLTNHIKYLQNFLKDKPTGDPSLVKFEKRLNGALEERAARYKGGQGVVAHMPPSALSAGLGFVYGYATADEDTDRVTNALEWAAVGAVAGSMAGRMLARSDASLKVVSHDKIPVGELPGGGWQGEMRKYIRPADPHAARPVPLLERFRNIYGGIVRKSYMMERWTQSVGASRLPVQSNPGKLMASFGRWRAQTEGAIRFGPSIHDPFGNIKRLLNFGVSDILDLVKGDSDGLGELMAARVKIALGDYVKTPFDDLTATMMYNAMPEVYHQAADMARQFSLAMADVMVDGGVISQSMRDMFGDESMYAALQRVFRFDTGAEVSADATSKAIAKATNPIKLRKGGSLDLVKNPFEVMIQTIPQFFRAAEMNRMKLAMVDAWEAADNPSWLMSRISKSEVEGSATHDAQIKALQEQIKGLTPANAEALVAGLNPGMVDPLKGTMRLYRNGVLESYRIPKEVAIAIQTLDPAELSALTKVVGAPARWASKGITMNPFFVAKMALYDGWQATLNSQYGFRFGVDNIKGFMASARQSQVYKDALEMGLTHQTLYNAGSQTTSGRISDVKLSLGTPIEVAINQLKAMHPIEAYKTLIGPLADAAKMGEFMRAKQHNASDIEALFAAKQVTANYSEVGSFAQMKALQHITMFLGPAIQVMDQAAYRGGVHPFRVPDEGRAVAAATYATKAFLSVTIPSLMFWAANYGDDQIDQMRQTQMGRKYWFLRTKAGIVKIPKPPIDGQIFGTSMETYLDERNGQDPQGTKEFATAILNDAAFNILPSAGVIPYSLQANQDLSSGRTIVPYADDNLELQMQGADKATWLARTISQKVAPALRDSKSQMARNASTPAGIDFLINSVTGMMGQDVALGVSQAIESQTKGYVPAKEELPLMKRIFADYPSTNVRSIESFYNRGQRVQMVAATIDHLAKTDPGSLGPYLEQNQTDLGLIKVYEQTRQILANYRRAITDIQGMDGKAVSSSDKRLYIKQYKTMMIQQAQETEQITQEADHDAAVYAARLASQKK